MGRPVVPALKPSHPALLFLAVGLLTAGCAVIPPGPGAQVRPAASPAPPAEPAREAGLGAAREQEAAAADPGREEPEPETVTAFKLVQGDCFAFPPAPGSSVEGKPGDGDGTVHRLPCSTRHTGQVYAVASIEDAGPYPGVGELQWLSDALCTAENDVLDPGLAAAVPGLKQHMMVPSPESWGYGDRRILCYVKSPQAFSGSLLIDL